MKINNEILKILSEYHIRLSDGICYLLSLFYGYKPSYIPNEFKEKIDSIKIYKIKNKNLHWNIPLFNNQDTNFEWVKTEYVVMFKKANPDKGGHVREAITRMKKIFSVNPEIRKDDIINATKLYLNNTNNRFIRLPHYFLEKGIGTQKTNDILDWIDKYKSIDKINDNNRITLR